MGVCLLVGEAKTDFSFSEITDLTRVNDGTNHYQIFSESELLDQITMLKNSADFALNSKTRSDYVEAFLEMQARKFDNLFSLERFVAKGLGSTVDTSRCTQFDWWFNWRSQIGGKLSSFECAILDTYRLADEGNRSKLRQSFPEYFVRKTYKDTPQGF